MVGLGELVVILELHQQGLTVSAIARRTGLHRETVRKYVERGLEAPAYGPRLPRPTKLMPFERFLRERIAAFPELTGRRLHRELGELGYAGGYTAVKEFLRDIRPAEPAGFEVRFETPPGRQAQVDFAHLRTVFEDEPGTEHIVWLFSFILGHSRMLWGRFVAHQDMQTLLRCHAAAFEALGGVPEQILYDRMRTVFAREDPETSHIIYNPTLIAFARHYGYLPRACQAYRAKTKGKVEHTPPGRRGAQPGSRAAHSRAGPARRGAPGHGGPWSAPDRHWAPHLATSGQQPDTPSRAIGGLAPGRDRRRP